MLLQKSEECNWGTTCTVVLIQLSQPWLTVFCHKCLFWGPLSCTLYLMKKEDLVLVLMLVQCQFNLGLKITQQQHPSREGVWKPRTSWPDLNDPWRQYLLSWHVAWGVHTLGSTLDWTSLQLLKTHHAFSEVLWVIVRSIFKFLGVTFFSFLKEYLSNSNLVQLWDYPSSLGH